MQWLAMLTMLTDHIGAYFAPGVELLRIIGRIAFPIYAYLIVRGMQRTRNRRQYLTRLAIIAILAQAIYAMMGLDRLNVVVLLMAGAGAIWTAERGWAAAAAAWIGAAAVCELIGAEYGLYGVAVMAVYHYCRGSWIVAGHAAVTAAAVVAGIMTTVQLWSILAAALLAWWPSLDRTRAPVWLWRSFYPAHLAIIAALLAAR